MSRPAVWTAYSATEAVTQAVLELEEPRQQLAALQASVHLGWRLAWAAAGCRAANIAAPFGLQHPQRVGLPTLDTLSSCPPFPLPSLSPPQIRHSVEAPLSVDLRLAGLVEAWASGCSWEEVGRGAVEGQGAGATINLT